MNGRQQQHNNIKEIPRRLRVSASAALKISVIFDDIRSAFDSTFLRKYFCEYFSKRGMSQIESFIDSNCSLDIS